MYKRDSWQGRTSFSESSLLAYAIRVKLYVCYLTPDRRKISTNVGKKVRNRVFDCHLSPEWRQMAIENAVSSEFDPRSAIFKTLTGSSDFDPRSSIVKSSFNCRLSCVCLL